MLIVQDPCGIGECLSFPRGDGLGLSGFRRSPAALAGALIIVLVTLIAALSIEYGGAEGGPAPRSFLARHVLAWGPQDEDPSIEAPPSSPDGRHYLGTDIQRRDLLSRVLHGAVTSLQIAIAAEIIALCIGLFVGAISGYSGGWMDALLMRATDILLALPLPILAMAALAVFDTRSATLVVIVLGLMGWAGIARLARVQCRSAAARLGAEAARALGAGRARVVVRHVLPEALAPVMVAASVGVGANILTEAWLSFLGLHAPAVSWGRMIVDARPDLVLRPWQCIVPGAALAVTVLGFVLLADGLRDLLDPGARAATHMT
jgi:ABC-type dipeptide/oligopeptide/nickel transport system permease subunit